MAPTPRPEAELRDAIGPRATRSGSGSSGGLGKKTGSLSSGLANVVGGMLVGFDEQVLRSTPRIEILVKRGKAVRGLSAQGGTLMVGMPDDPVVVGGPTTDAADEPNETP